MNGFLNQRNVAKTDQVNAVTVCSPWLRCTSLQIQFTQSGICLANKLFPQFATNILSEFLTPL